MKKILYISTFLPYKDSKFPAAGSNTTLNNIKDLYEVGNIIDYCALINENEYKNREECKNEYLNRIILFKITKLRKILNVLFNFTLPTLCSVRYDKRIKKFLKEKQKNYDVVILDFTQNISYIKEIDKCKKILIEHDISFQAFERKKENEKNILKKFLYNFEYKRLKKYEENMISKFDTIIVQNKKDFTLIENKNQNIKILQPFYNKFEIERSKNDNNINIGFFGAMNRLENEEAAIFFLEKIWSSVYDKNIYFYIIGANPSEKLKNISSKYKNVILTGFVDDVKKYFSLLDIGVIPLIKGAGIKIKTVEMLYSEIPVVSTTVGIEGILSEDKKEFLLAENEKEFIKNINKLIIDKELYKKLKDNLKKKKEKLVIGEKIVELI